MEKDRAVTPPPPTGHDSPVEGIDLTPRRSGAVPSPVKGGNREHPAGGVARSSHRSVSKLIGGSFGSTDEDEMSTDTSSVSPGTRQRELERIMNEDEDDDSNFGDAMPASFSFHPIFPTLPNASRTTAAAVGFRAGNQGEAEPPPPPPGPPPRIKIRPGTSSYSAIGIGHGHAMEGAGPAFPPLREEEEEDVDDPEDCKLTQKEHPDDEDIPNVPNVPSGAPQESARKSNFATFAANRRRKNVAAASTSASAESSGRLIETAFSSSSEEDDEGDTTSALQETSKQSQGEEFIANQPNQQQADVAIDRLHTDHASVNQADVQAEGRGPPQSSRLLRMYKKKLTLKNRQALSQGSNDSPHSDILINQTDAEPKNLVEQSTQQPTHSTDQDPTGSLGSDKSDSQSRAAYPSQPRIIIGAIAGGDGGEVELATSTSTERAGSPVEGDAESYASSKVHHSGKSKSSSSAAQSIGAGSRELRDPPSLSHVSSTHDTSTAPLQPKAHGTSTAPLQPKTQGTPTAPLQPKTQGTSTAPLQLNPDYSRPDIPQTAPFVDVDVGVNVAGSQTSASGPPASAAAALAAAWATHSQDRPNRINPNYPSGNRNTQQSFHGDLSNAVLPDVLITMRQKLESLTLFDSDMMRLAGGPQGTGGAGVGRYNYGPSGGNSASFFYEDEDERESKESLRRSFQQSISAAVLVSLAHKRYERRRLAAMEIEKVVRSLVQQMQRRLLSSKPEQSSSTDYDELGRVRAILILLSDDYVRSTSEDARKGGVVALAACAIGLKKASAVEEHPAIVECKDLIMASVLHACQDHSQRVRYYATESLFNVVKVLPALAVQHFFILFEILRSLYADVDMDVRRAAELLDKKLKEVIIGAINSGSFSADSCVPLFARFVYMRNKPTKRLTLTWLQQFSEKLIGSPLLEFLHLFLGGIFQMVADPDPSVRQLSLSFLKSALPRLVDSAGDEALADDGASMTKVDFDKIIQGLVSTMEHPDPLVRKVAMYWIFQIVETHMADGDEIGAEENTGRIRRRRPQPSTVEDEEATGGGRFRKKQNKAAVESVRNSVPHVLPGLLLSIGDSYEVEPDNPEQRAQELAERTNAHLQAAVKRDGDAFVPYLDSFIVALREELDSPGGIGARTGQRVERKPYRMDVKPDGSGIESTGWFRAAEDSSGKHRPILKSRLCALDWIMVLYDSVVPDAEKAEYAREFVTPILQQLVEFSTEVVLVKSLEVLAKITVPVSSEGILSPSKKSNGAAASTESGPRRWVAFDERESGLLTITDGNAAFALDILDDPQRELKSRNRDVFAMLVRLHSEHEGLIPEVGRVVEVMCRLQPAEFVFVSFALELDRYVLDKVTFKGDNTQRNSDNSPSVGHILAFASSFVQQMNSILLTSQETVHLRNVLKDCVGYKGESTHDERRFRLFQIMLHSFAHNIVATISLCLWAGAFQTAAAYMHRTDPLDLDLMFYLELDRLIELLERPLFRHLHLRMLESDDQPNYEGSGAMLFVALKSLLMLLPQSTSYRVLKERLMTVARFRQSTVSVKGVLSRISRGTFTNMFVTRMIQIRRMHCDSKWRTVRSESLERPEADGFYTSAVARSCGEEAHQGNQQVQGGRPSRFYGRRVMHWSGKGIATGDVGSQLSDRSASCANDQSYGVDDEQDNPRMTRPIVADKASSDGDNQDREGNWRSAVQLDAVDDNANTPEGQWKNFWSRGGEIASDSHSPSS